MSTQHYEQFLAEVYDWMQGGWDERTEANRHHFDALGVGPSAPGADAIDIGAGTGYQSIPLAELGFSVTAIDPSAAMLGELSTHVGALPITTTMGTFDDYAGPPVELFCCMGDTLAHFETHDEVDDLLRRSHETLTSDGVLILTFRDGTSQPAGDSRFLPIRSDTERIFTCFLETIDDDHTRVHDILHTRHADGFTQQVSSYTKLRLRTPHIEAALTHAGYSTVATSTRQGLATLMASK